MKSFQCVLEPNFAVVGLSGQMGKQEAITHLRLWACLPVLPREDTKSDNVEELHVGELTINLPRLIKY